MSHQDFEISYLLSVCCSGIVDSHVTPELSKLHIEKELFIDPLLCLSHSYPTCTVAVSVCGSFVWFLKYLRAEQDRLLT